MTEFTGRTVSEAIEAGLEALGLSDAAARIEILEEGRGGVFGLGIRPARVRITPIDADAPEVEGAGVAADAPTEDEPVAPPAPVVDSEQMTGAGMMVDVETAHTLEIARAFLQGMLDRMNMKTEVEGSIVPPVDSQDELSYYLNINGEDLSTLIGRRGETLDDIQYLVRLVINQQTRHWPHIEVDVEHYKQRRQHSLQRLAENMADRAVREKRVIALEAMPARERRLIHLSLRNRADVRTESIGAGENRKVTIIPL